MGMLKTWRSSIRGNWRKAVLGVAGLGIATGAFCWGRCGAAPQTAANPAAATQVPAVVSSEPQPPSDYATRPVAQVFGKDITRAEFGEYLINRLGDRIDNFVNKRVIEESCARHGIVITDAEIELEFKEQMKRMNVQPKDFVDVILKRYNKTMFEWKEDVIRPELLLRKYCASMVTVDPDDLKKAFDSYYGAKVYCRMIMWPKADLNKVRDVIYPKIRDDKDEFEMAATHQASARLASVGGQLDRPITRHSTGSDVLEDIAFGLHDGELSRVFEVGEWIAVLKCVSHAAPDNNIKLEDKRAELAAEIKQKKIDMMIPEVVKKMREEAHVSIYIKPVRIEEELVRRAGEAMKQNQDGTLKSAIPTGQAPHGN